MHAIPFPKGRAFILTLPIHSESRRAIESRREIGTRGMPA